MMKLWTAFSCSPHILSLQSAGRFLYSEMCHFPNLIYSEATRAVCIHSALLLAIGGETKINVLS